MEIRPGENRLRSAGGGSLHLLASAGGLLGQVAEELGPRVEDEYQGHEDPGGAVGQGQRVVRAIGAARVIARAVSRFWWCGQRSCMDWHAINFPLKISLWVIHCESLIDNL